MLKFIKSAENSIESTDKIVKRPDTARLRNHNLLKNMQLLDQAIMK